MTPEQNNENIPTADFYDPVEWPTVRVPAAELEAAKAVIDQQAAEIEQLHVQLKLATAPCAGCGLRELHKACPAWGTPAYMNDKHPAWGSVHGIVRLKTDHLRTIIADAKRMLGEVVVLEDTINHAKGKLLLSHNAGRMIVNGKDIYLLSDAGRKLVSLADKLTEAEKGTP